MLTVEQNDRLTRVGPGAPCGELMRRYWHPIAAVSQMNDRYTMPIRLLSEDLVLYKDRSGTFGLIEPRCPHRRMSLIYGIPLENGIRCPYHGWAFDQTGQCIEQPYEETEDPEGRFKEKIRAKAYPVEVLGGLVWAYMGPAPAPLLPRWDYLVMENVVRDVGYAVLPCNWLQCQENSIDSVHVEWLHGHWANYIEEMLGREERKRVVSQHAKIGFDVFEYGIYKRHGYTGATEDDTFWADGHPIIFPYTLRQGGDGLDRSRWGPGEDGPAVQIRVPLDDTHTGHWWVRSFHKAPEDPAQKDRDVPFFQFPPPGPDQEGRPQWNLLDAAPPQDMLAWITQGGIADRTTENLGRSDKGIILYRRMLDENIRIVEDGGDPKNTFRDPAGNVYLGMITESATGQMGAPRANAGASMRDARRDNRFGGLTSTITTRIG